MAMFYWITKPKERDTLKMETTESDSPGCQASEDLKRGRMWGVLAYTNLYAQLLSPF